MEFIYNLRNFEATEGLREHFEKKLQGLKRALKTFGHFEKKGDILIEKLPRGQYLARIYMHLGKHHFQSTETGCSPVEALHRATDQIRTQALKIKENYVSY